MRGVACGRGARLHLCVGWRLVRVVWIANPRSLVAPLAGQLLAHNPLSAALPHLQIVIGANKEAIIAEKRCTARLGQTALVGYSGG